jgi:hypothetical protein
MKVFIVYDKFGEERGYVYAKNHNDAEKKAHYMYGPQASVAYTEI